MEICNHNFVPAKVDYLADGRAMWADRKCAVCGTKPDSNWYRRQRNADRVKLTQEGRQKLQKSRRMTVLERELLGALNDMLDGIAGVEAEHGSDYLARYWKQASVENARRLLDEQEHHLPAKGQRQ